MINIFVCMLLISTTFLSTVGTIKIKGTEVDPTCYQCATPPPDMISWWTGENDAQDLIGDNDGTWSGTTSYTPGMVGNTFDFNGNSYVEVPDNPTLNLGTKDFTIDFWMKLGTWGVMSKYDTQTHIGFAIASDFVDGPEPLEWGLFFRINTEDYIASHTGYFGDPTYVAIVVDRDAENELSIYINDLPVQFFDVQSTGSVSNNKPLIIGDSSPYGKFNGWIDEIEIFGRALTEAEVTSIYNAGSAGKCKTPTWEYYFNPIGPYANVPGGCLTVWATWDCRRVCPALFMGYINTRQHYSGPIPDSITTPDGVTRVINDIQYDFVWDWSCHNYEVNKYTIAKYKNSSWALEPLSPWIQDNLNQAERYPNIALINPPQAIYTIMRGDILLQNPPVFQDEYFIENGTCPELPGYYIGTTPITFNSNAGPENNPFVTEPFTGLVVNAGEICLSPVPVDHHPEVEIQSGLGIGTTAIIKNPHNETFTNLHWNMTITGLKVYPSGGKISGVINTLTPGQEIKIRSGLVIGFGPTAITVQVDDCVPASKNGTMLLFIIKVK